MTGSRHEVETLFEKARELPYGQTQVALLEEAVQLADSLNDIDLAYAARDKLMHSACFSGKPDLMLIAFSWCLAQFDRDPTRFNSHNILWKYKWVVINSRKFPQISRTRLEELLADMERRYREAGSTMQAVASARWGLLEHFGEKKQAQAARALARKRRNDDLSDCPVCTMAGNCHYYRLRGQWSRAVQAAEPIVKNGLSCGAEPHSTLALVLRPLLYLGRLDEAKAYHRQGYRLVSQGSHLVGQQADHLEFVTLAGEMARAKQLLERHLPAALEVVPLDERFEFLLSARLWTDRVLGRETRRLKIRLPQGLVEPGADGKTDVKALGDHFTAQLQDLAGRFDARNGTRAFQERIDRLPELLRVAVP